MHLAVYFDLPWGTRVLMNPDQFKRFTELMEELPCITDYHGGNKAYASEIEWTGFHVDTYTNKQLKDLKNKTVFGVNPNDSDSES